MGRKITPEKITELKAGEIFVFGSNTEGRHGAGAAKFARDSCGARYGQAIGPQGNSYAIVTKHLPGGRRSVSLDFIHLQIATMLEYAKYHPNYVFLVTKIGCELAGFTPDEIVACFPAMDIPSNVSLPQEFWDLIDDDDRLSEAFIKRLNNIANADQVQEAESGCEDTFSSEGR